MMDTSSVDRFLAETLRKMRAGVRSEWTLGADTDWRSVWARIEYHGIPLLLHQNTEWLSTWPQPLLDRITEEARLIILWETTHHDSISKVLSALQADHVEAVLMKGTALAYSFHTEPATRRRGDTDLLVQPKHQERTRAILSKLGWYRKDDPHGLYFQEGWLHDAAGFFVHSIDLHWEPSDRPVLHSVLPIENFFARKQPVARFGAGAFRPDTATMILHATTNQKWHAQHGYDAEDGRLSSPKRLIWSVDFDLMVADMEAQDWDRLTAHCEREGVGPLVAEALRGAREDLGTELPEEALTKLERTALSQDIQAYFSDSDSLSQFWLDLRKTKGLDKKLRLIATRGLAPRDHLVEKYPSLAAWPTALLQGRFLLGTAGRLLRRMVSS